jgi:hypothetical protein
VCSWPGSTSTSDLGTASGAEIWSLVTFLIVPVLVFEGMGPLAAMKRSAELFRERWGQQVTGTLVIGGVSGLILLAGIVIGIVGLVAVFGGATRGVFGVALYRYVAEDRTLEPFTAADLDAAARSR